MFTVRAYQAKMTLLLQFHYSFSPLQQWFEFLASNTTLASNSPQSWMCLDVAHWSYSLITLPSRTVHVNAQLSCLWNEASMIIRLCICVWWFAMLIILCCVLFFITKLCATGQDFGHWSGTWLTANIASKGYWQPSLSTRSAWGLNITIR